MKKGLPFLIAALMTVSAIAVALPASAKATFSDVEAGRWSEASIKYAVDNNYMKGVGGNKFDPEGSLTRAMVATVLWRREGEPEPTGESGFVDVPADEWYTNAVAWAKETGVVKGITDKTFEPDGLITREQLATMLFRFSSNAPVSVPERADLSPFADDEKVSDWAGEPLEWAVEAGLIKGTDGNRLAPEGNATREQFVYDNAFVKSYFSTNGFGFVSDGKLADGLQPDGTGWEDLYKRYYLDRVNEGEEGYEIWRETFPSLYAFEPDVENPFVYNSIFCPWDSLHDNVMFGIGYGIAPEVIQHGEVYNNQLFSEEENPYFVNPTKGDYRVKDGADFFKIPFEDMGRY